MSKKSKKVVEIERYEADPAVGLLAEQVVKRKEQNLVNKDKSKAGRSYLEIVTKNVFTFFNILCFIVAGVLIALGEIGECFFLIIILSNMLIGIIQEIRSKVMVEKLSIMSEPIADVVRDGIKQQIAVRDIVLDDICIYESGRQIAADGALLSGTLSVNESMLTGESADVKKQAGDPLFAGSFVTSGNGAARCEKVGGETYISRLAVRAKKLKKNVSPILKTLNRIIRVIGFAIIPIAVLVAVKCYFVTTDHNLHESLVRTAGAMIGLIPSGMFLLTSVALAVGVIKLALNKTLVQDLYCIEMLARCDTLCLDKTGTITDGTMTVANVELLRETDMQQVMSSFLCATGDNNSTAKALVQKFGVKNYLSAERTLPFSSATKLSAVTFESGKTYVLGAAEFVLKETDKVVTDKILEYSMNGMRVLLLAESDLKIENDLPPKDVTPVAIIAIEDHIREEAIPTIAWFKENKVSIKIISGDNPVTVSHIARRVGVENADRFISLDGMSENDVIAAANEYTVFGRVTPDQKALLVSAMKRAGKTIAMTGDGVNDILAFKEADCSVAMAGGSDAAKNVASLVLMDSNFANMPKVVAEGRRVVNNIQQSASVYLMKTVFVALTILLTLGSYPFTPKNLMVLEFFVIGIPTFFLALQPNNRIISGNFLAMLLKRAVPSAIVLILNFSAMWIACAVMGVPQGQQITMQVLTVTFAGLAMLALICFPYNLYRGVLVALMALGAGAAFLILPGYFEVVRLELWQALAVALSVSVSLPVGVILHYTATKLNLKRIRK